MSTTARGATPEAGSDCGCSDFRLSRRTLLKAAGLGGVLTLGSSLVPVQAAFGSASVPTDTLVVLFLRGGADWLSLVPPLADPGYRAHRPTIAVPANRAIQLDSMFGMHPAMKALKPFWQSGKLSFVHAAASDDPTRSHFDAQNAIELGTYNNSGPISGWLDRYLEAVPGGGSFDAVARSTAAPLSLSGGVPTLAASSLDNFGIPSWLGQRYRDAVAGQYAGITHAMAREARIAFDAMATVQSRFGTDGKPSNGAVYPDGDLGDSMQDIARLVKANVGARVVTADFSPWDMHTDIGDNGGVDGGQMFDAASQLGDALGAFATDLGPALDNVTLVTVTDFGRRVQENDSQGLDHGHGQAMLLLGGAVHGGQVVTSWPGLGDGSLDQGDLAGTIDLRTVFGSILHSRMGAGDAQVRKVFPGFRPNYLNLTASR
jgi:uncharacterized protein (DUF1501 family)